MWYTIITEGQQNESQQGTELKTDWQSSEVAWKESIESLELEKAW